MNAKTFKNFVIDRIVPGFKSSRLNRWLSADFERRLSAIVVFFTLFFSVLIFLFSGTPSGGGGHGEEGHGGGHDGGGSEHGEHEEEAASIELDDDVLESNGIIIEQVKAVSISPKVNVRGSIVENKNIAMTAKARFSGTVKAVFKDFGEKVKKGETLASIESANAQALYQVRSNVDGVVAEKFVVPGAFVPENEAIFRVVDLTSVWFETRVPEKDAKKMKAGQKISIKNPKLGAEAVTTLSYVSPVVDEDTQSCLVRAEVSNLDAQWMIGEFTEAIVSLDESKVDLAVKKDAVQVLNGDTVVFVRKEDEISAAKIATGISDREWIEIKEGLDSQDLYVSENSFLAKAELLKATAEHEH